MTILGVEVAMNEQLMGAELIVAGDLNVDLERTDGQGKYEEITSAVPISVNYQRIDCILSP